jgi:LPXTG-motif cell wall-anchored protein
MSFEDEMNEMRLDSDLDSDLDSSGDTPPPEESGNRTFLIVAGILGAITIIALVCIVAYAMFYLPRRQSQQETQVAELNAQNTAMALAIQQTAQAAAITPTPTKSEEQKQAQEYKVEQGETPASIAKKFGVDVQDLLRLNNLNNPDVILPVGAIIFIPKVQSTPTSSPTPLLAVPTDTPVPTTDPRTATVAALLTQAASAQLTPGPTTTALPSTGFADQVGIPGLVGMAILLIAVIFLARRLRTT